MLTVISPAKTLDFETKPHIQSHSQPDFVEDSEKLIRKLRTLSRKKIGELMSISKPLAELNHQRYLEWEPEFSLETAKQAVLAFKGDVYIGMDADTFSEEDLDFAQGHLRILSGLYGLLKPLDLIRPYRLEMGTRLPVRRKKNLYDFWGDRLTKSLNASLAETGDRSLVNLASNEYFDAVMPQKLQGEVVTPVFKDWKNGEYKIISFFAKKARGRMASWIIRHRMDQPDGLKDYDLDGYAFDPTASTAQDWVFTRRLED